MLYVFLYLAAIVAANLSVTHFGPSSSVINAFLFIGLDLTSRDGLHDRWQHRCLWRKMALLIASGSALSWALNRNAGRVALASFVAFALAGLADALLYHRLRERPRLQRVNGSNLLSALVDSLVFPVLAFGWPPMLWICTGQFVAKVAGGALWSWLLFDRRGLKAALGILATLAWCAILAASVRAVGLDTLTVAVAVVATGIVLALVKRG